MKINQTTVINIGLLILLEVLISCQHTGTQINKPALIETKSVIASTAAFYNEIKGYGTLQAINTLDLEAKFDGIVQFNNLKGEIKKGEIVYTLQGPEIDLERENLKNSLVDARNQFNYLKQYYEIKKKLLTDNYLARIDYESVAKDFQNAQNALTTAQYKLNYFHAMTAFRAPFDGSLDNLQVPQGEDAVAGQLLGTFQNDNVLKLVAKYYGNPDSLTSREFLVKINGQAYQSKLIYREKAINPSMGGRILWVALKDPGHQLNSGDYVLFSFLGNKSESVAVPDAAIVQEGSETFVITVKNGEYYKTTVKTGCEKNGFAEIKSGLNAGTRVLTQGAFEVFYGKLGNMNVED